MMHQQATIERREEELSRCLRNLGLRGHQFSLVSVYCVMLRTVQDEGDKKKNSIML